MKKFLLGKFMTGLLFVSLFSFSCASTVTKVEDLSLWIGSYSSMDKLYKEAGEQGFWEKVAGYSEGYSKEEVEAFFMKMFSNDFTTFDIKDGENVIIDGNIKAKYNYVGSLAVKWQDKDIKWEIFRTENQDAVEAGFRNLLMIPIHAHSKDDLSHWHLRYGNMNFDYLATDSSLKNWWPTCYSPKEAEKKNAVKNIIKKAKLMSTMLPEK